VNVWKVILATLVIFITGVVTGALVVGITNRVAQKHLSRGRQETHQPNNPSVLPNSNPREGRPQNSGTMPNRLRAGINMEFLEKLDAEVSLTSGQRERLQQIIADGQLRNKRIWDNVAPEIRHENLETQKRIREVLTPEQLVRFEELMKQTRPMSRPREQKPPVVQENLQTAPK
jgi:hypothetical protein